MIYWYSGYSKDIMRASRYGQAYRITKPHAGKLPVAGGSAAQESMMQRFDHFIALMPNLHWTNNWVAPARTLRHPKF